MSDLSPNISVVEESPQVRAIVAGPTAVPAMMGITERGPYEATLVTSFADFKKKFGGYTVNGDLPFTVQSFFDGGGQACYIKRVVHYTDISVATPATAAAAEEDLLSAATGATAGYSLASIAAPYALTTGDTLVVTPDGGSPSTATFTGVAAQRTAAATAPYTLANAQTLLVAVNGGSVQSIQFLTAEFVDITNATAAEVAAVLGAKLVGIQASVVGGAPRITSDRKGTGSSINVSGGTANADLAFTTGSVAGTGNVSDLSAVTAAEVKTIVEAAVAGVTVTTTSNFPKITSNTTGTGSSILVGASSTADDEMGFDNATHSGTTGAAVAVITVHAKTDGTYGNTVEATVAAATNGETDDFNLTVTLDGDIVAVWPDLSTDSTSARFCETIVNDSETGDDYISLETLVASTRPASASITLSGGNDGLGSIADTDFTGNSAARTGVYGFNALDDGDATLLLCPDRITAAVQVALINYCAITKRGTMFAILDAPAGLSVTAVRTYVKTTAGLKNLSEFGAFYYPQAKILNPNKSLFGNTATLVVPPSGMIAGAYARTDGARIGGVYDAPAGTERGILVGCQGFESDYTQEPGNRDLLYPDRINPLRAEGGIRCIDGVRTLKGDGNFPTVAERRGVISIESAVKAGITFAKFRNNDAILRAEVQRTIDAYLLTQMQVGAFRSRKPAEAFYTDVSAKLNPPSSVFAGKLIIAIGLATQKPAEFIEIRVSQDTRSLNAELAA